MFEQHLYVHDPIGGKLSKGSYFVSDCGGVGPVRKDNGQSQLGHESMSSVLQYSEQTFLWDALSLAKWCMVFMCCNRTEAVACFSSLSAPWLSV